MNNIPEFLKYGAPYIIALISIVWALTWKATESKATEAKEIAICAKRAAAKAGAEAGMNKIRIDGIKEDIGEIKVDIGIVKDDVKDILLKFRNGNKLT